MVLETKDQAPRTDAHQRKGNEPPSKRWAMRPDAPCTWPHGVSFVPFAELSRRRRMATMDASPAPASARTPATTRLPSCERDAPPKPVCAPPEGTAPSAAAIVGETPDPPAPVEPDPFVAATPPEPVPPEPVPPEPDALVPDAALPDGVVVVVTGATKLLISAVVQVTALPPPVAVPLH
jgi:hypothetical protein